MDGTKKKKSNFFYHEGYNDILPHCWMLDVYTPFRN